MAHSIHQGYELYMKLSRVTDKYLDATLSFIGTVPFDEYVKKAVQKQKCVTEIYPRSPAAMAFHKIAKKTQNWPTPKSVEGHLEFFIERLINYSGHSERLNS